MARLLAAGTDVIFDASNNQLGCLAHVPDLDACEVLKIFGSTKREKTWTAKTTEISWISTTLLIHQIIILSTSNLSRKDVMVWRTTSMIAHNTLRLSETLYISFVVLRMPPPLLDLNLLRLWLVINSHLIHPLPLLLNRAIRFQRKFRVLKIAQFSF